MPRFALGCLLLACLAAPAQAQQVTIPGRQVVEDNGFLLEVDYTSSQVRLRLFDLSGQPVDMSGLWIRRCSVDLIAQRGDRRPSSSLNVRLVRPEDGSLPYLLARHQVGALHELDALLVAVKLKNVAGRGDVNDRWRVSWRRYDVGLCGEQAAPACRDADHGCVLCRHRLCVPPLTRPWR